MSPKSAPLRSSVALAFFAAAALLSSGAAVSAAAPPPGELSRLEGFSGLVKTGKNEYLTVYDRKVKSTDARLARITIVKEGTYAQPIEVADWKGDRPNDLEAVCQLPSGEFLAAESGVREGQFGRIFRLAIAGGKGEVKAVYAGAKVLESTKEGKGDDYEGLLCAPGAEGKILIVQGERGGSKPYPHAMLRWGWLDLAAGTLAFSPEGLKGLEVAPQRPLWPGTEQRDIADLYADAEGNVWAAAATDGGDSGPYRSFVYQLGKLQPGQEPPIALEKDPKPLFTVDGFKIEALAAPWTDSGFLAIGTEDEEIGGVVRELFKPLE